MRDEQGRFPNPPFDPHRKMDDAAQSAEDAQERLRNNPPVDDGVHEGDGARSTDPADLEADTVNPTEEE